MSASLRKAIVRLARENPELRKHLVPLLQKRAALGKGKNGYIALYKGKRLEVYADTPLEARDTAAQHFKARKPWEVHVTLAEKSGKPVVHLPLD